MLTLYHGTSAKNAKQIKKKGFITDKKYNWEVPSKKGFVYLSSAYAPFYAMTSNKVNGKLALVKTEIDEEDCYPEDDFLMRALFGKSVYTKQELELINMEIYKHLWPNSLKHMGNIATKPDSIKIIGIRYFDGKNLLYKCDPSISPMNYKFMGDYYKRLTKWIYEGKDILQFPRN